MNPRPLHPFLPWSLLAAGLLTSCASASRVREFPRSPTVWHLDDQRPFFTPPAEMYSPYVWDALNYSLFKPLSHVWLLKVKKPAQDVNAFDEVANSSWYTNRLSTRTLSTAELAQGACPDSQDQPSPPLTIVKGKPDGASPGFTVEDARGKRVLLKVDGLLQPERSSAADVIGAAVFHAAGYFVPCNRVWFVRKSDLRLKPGVTTQTTRGEVIPLTTEHVDQALAQAVQSDPDHYRFTASEFIAGKPLGPWRYEGTKEGDPNDRIPHEDRRSNRGMRIFASWLDHVDTRQENTLLIWNATSPQAGYITHYRVDFGDAFGSFTGFSDVAQRLGHVGYMDFGQAFIDFTTLGLIDHPWHDTTFGPAGPALGYYSAETFEAEGWEPGYPNPAFDAAQEADFAWAARILARITPEHIQALVARARLRAADVHAELIHILTERRRRILERYLTRLSPLTWPQVKDGSLHLEDLLLRAGLRQPHQRHFTARLFFKDNRTGIPLPTYVQDTWVRIHLPEDLSGYGVVRVEPERAGAPDERPLWVHLEFADGQATVRGLERPENGELPQWP